MPTSIGLYSPAPTDVSVQNQEMKHAKAKATIGLLSVAIGYISLNSLFRAIVPQAFIWQDEDREEAQWLATSKSWLDQKACRWLGICGAAHLQFAGPRLGHRTPNGHQPVPGNASDWDWQKTWLEGKERPENWSDDERGLREIPDYVMEYAPLVHLFSGEQFWPGDIAEHLYHVIPTLNYTPLQPRWRHPTLKNLDALNEWEHGRYIFLTSNDDVEGRPGWLEGEKNIPNPPREAMTLQDAFGPHYPGRHYLDLPREFAKDDKEYEMGKSSSRDWNGDRVVTPEGNLVPVVTPEGEELIPERTKTNRPIPITKELRRRNAKPLINTGYSPNSTHRVGHSAAPAILIVVDKGHGIVDAFWFFFYSFNLGNVVLNVRFGNHVGDWEHSAIRFRHGKPEAIYFSEHSFGSAYSYDAVEKRGKRPVIYSATGTHAMYSTPGIHSYILPWGLLHDETDRGPLWDPALNLHAYRYDHINDTLRSSNLTPRSPTEWFFFNGHWGDKFYPLGDRRQYRFAGQYHYENGPLGPKFKRLGRDRICPGGAEDPCVIKQWLGSEGLRVQRSFGAGRGDEWSREDEVRILGSEKEAPGR